MQYKCQIKAHPQHIRSSVKIKFDHIATTLVRYYMILYVVKLWLLHSPFISSVFLIVYSFLLLVRVCLQSEIFLYSLFKIIPTYTDMTNA